MKQHSYRAWVHPTRRLSLIYSSTLGGWILKRHRKDGGVNRHQRTIFGAGPDRDVALRRVRAGYEEKPPMSGWVRATGRSRCTTWRGVHEDIYQQSTQ